MTCRLLTTLALTGMLSMWLPCSGTAGPDDADSAAELKKLLESTDYRKLASLPAEWRKKLPEKTQKRIILACLDNLKSMKKLPMDNLGNVFVVRREKPEDKKAKEDAVVINQDLFTEGGRCAWAIEKMLACSLPVISADLADDKKDRLVKNAHQIVVEAMVLPYNETVPVEKLSVEERARLGAALVHVKIQEKLAKDDDLAVRVAIAKNPRTSMALLNQMATDKDVGVRWEVCKNRNTVAGTISFMSRSDPDPSLRKAALKRLTDPESEFGPIEID